MTLEEKQVVDRVADLVKTYFFVQGIAGENDYIPHAIAYALKQGFIRCNSCLGTGIKPLSNENCERCSGTGKINFTINGD